MGSIIYALKVLDYAELLGDGAWQKAFILYLGQEDFKFI